MAAVRGSSSDLPSSRIFGLRTRAQLPPIRFSANGSRTFRYEE